MDTLHTVHWIRFIAKTVDRPTNVHYAASWVLFNPYVINLLSYEPYTATALGIEPRYRNF